MMCDPIALQVFLGADNVETFVGEPQFSNVPSKV